MNEIVHTDQFDELIQEVERQCDRRNPDAVNSIAQARQIAARTGLTRHQVLVNYAQAYYDCFIQAAYDDAITRLTDTLSELDASDYAAYGFKLSLTLGNSFQLKGDIYSAQECYLRGMRCLDAKASLTQAEEIFLASFNYNLSMLLTTSELQIDTEEYLAKSIALYEKHNRKFQLTMCYVAYALVLERKEDYPRAVAYLTRALELDKDIQNPYSQALSKANMGILLVKMNEYEQSFTYLKDALEYYESQQLQYEIGMIKLELGQAYLHTGRTELGFELVTEAEAIMLTLDNKKELSQIYRIKSRALSSIGKHEDAYAYLEKHLDSLKFFFDNEKNNALTRAKKEFESERKEKEAALMRAKNEEIEEYVHKLEISNNELKQFAHVASHDLREPLRMISSYLQLLQKSLNGNLSEQQAEFFGFVTDGARRMDMLIQDLLRLAKVDANPVIEKVKLGNVVEEIKLNLDILTRERGALIHMSPMPLILADRTQMLQLFQNLIANGIKYNKSTTPEIRIRCTEREDHLEIQVSDNGIGIPGHLREEVFQIFKRLQQVANTPGSGIGLSICKKIVESMGGKIRIEDRPEGGTIFRILLPLAVLCRD